MAPEEFESISFSPERETEENHSIVAAYNKVSNICKWLKYDPAVTEVCPEKLQWRFSTSVSSLAQIINYLSLFSSLHNNGDDSDQSLFCVRIQRLLSARTLHHHHTISTLPHQRPSQGPNTSLTQQPTVDIMTHLPINITLPMMISYTSLKLHKVVNC